MSVKENPGAAPGVSSGRGNGIRSGSSDTSAKAPFVF